WGRVAPRAAAGALAAPRPGTPAGAPARPAPPAPAGAPPRAPAGAALGRHRLMKVFRKSRPAAVLATATCASTSLGGACAMIAAPKATAKERHDAITARFMGS